MNNGFQASCEIRGDGLNKKCLNLNEDRVGGWVDVLNRPHGGLDTHGSADPEKKKCTVQQRHHGEIRPTPTAYAK
jgi:hypothetical protein